MNASSNTSQDKYTNSVQSGNTGTFVSWMEKVKSFFSFLGIFRKKGTQVHSDKRASQLPDSSLRIKRKRTSGRIEFRHRTTFFI
jgi:hypothetical protein